MAGRLSERYVNELLFEAGASFTTRLNELRLRKAAELLQHAQRRISDVAFECGFNDLSYFNRCFRHRFGLTPSAARGRRSRYLAKNFAIKGADIKPLATRRGSCLASDRITADREPVGFMYREDDLDSGGRFSGRR